MHRYLVYTLQNKITLRELDKMASTTEAVLAKDYLAHTHFRFSPLSLFSNSIPQPLLKEPELAEMSKQQYCI
jgi:hypothetical protein